jgi:protein ImuB
MSTLSTSPATQQTPHWIAVWLPRLSTDRWYRSGAAPADRRPLALYAKDANAFRLTAVDARAAQAGLAPAMSLADARAIRPDLATYEADDAADVLLLEQIAGWCDRFTPIVVPSPPHGLFLDVSGCTHLFGDSENLRAQIETRLAAQGFAVQVALAPTPGAAWALARHGTTRLIEDRDALPAALAPLPVAALRLADDAAALLKRLGLKTIGQILDAPRQPFAARIGRPALRRLDQALGRACEVLTPHRPPPAVFALRPLAEPITTMDAVLTVTEILCGDLCAQLAARGFGARLLRLSLFGVDGRTRSLGLGLSRPGSDAAVMLRLLRERLHTAPETLDAEFGFEAVRLDAMEVAPIILVETDLAPASARDPDAEARLVDTLTARLGSSRVGRLSLRNVHAPERASAWVMAGDGTPTTPAPPHDKVVRRPLRMFARAQPVDAIASVPDGPPVRFRWRRVLHEIVRAEGPERISPDWLRAPDTRTRDYYRVEDKDGRRFWLYREGFFGGDEAPRWFLHGLFP